jgi:hypothetical protein
MGAKKIRKDAYNMISKKSIAYHIDKLESKKYLMIDYLKLKTSEGDWHGVADAAMDIREIDAELIAWREVK